MSVITIFRNDDLDSATWFIKASSKRTFIIPMSNICQIIVSPYYPQNAKCWLWLFVWDPFVNQIICKSDLNRTDDVTIEQIFDINFMNMTTGRGGNKWLMWTIVIVLFLPDSINRKPFLCLKLNSTFVYLETITSYHKHTILITV